MDDGTFRKQVSYDQMTELLRFLQEYPNLAKGLARGQRGKIHSVKLWNQCSKKLNEIEDGASKTAKGWSKYWCDWKYRVRRKALAIKAAKESNRPLPDGFVPLSDMDKIIVELIGESAIDGVVIKSIESLENDGVESTSNYGNGASGAVPQFSGARQSSRATRSRKRRNSTREISEDDIAEPSSPPERKPRMHHENDAATESDCDWNVEEFIRIEKRRLEFSQGITEFMQSIAANMTRLTDAMLHIRDVVHNNFNRVNMN